MGFSQGTLKLGIAFFTEEIGLVLAFKGWVRVYQIRRTEKNFLDQESSI